MPDQSILSVVACKPKRPDAAPKRRRIAASRRIGKSQLPARADKRRIRVAIADMEGVFRLGLKRLLMSDEHLEVVAEIGQPEHLVSEAVRLSPDVMFVQHEMLMSGTGALGELRLGSPCTRLVVTASAFAEGEAVAFVEAGAHGAILKTADPVLFLKCTHKLAEGEVWLPKQQVAEIARRLTEHGTRPVDTLTMREKLVISCLVREGRRNREIARHLSITEQTVKNHLRSIYDKIGVSDRVELVLYAIHQHLELPPVGTKESPGQEK